MSEAVSALGGTVFDGAVRIEEAGLRGMVTLRGDLASARMKKAVKGVAGTAVPGPRQSLGDGTRGVLWMSPDELLVLVPHAEADAAAEALSRALTGEHHLAANVSDARATFRLEGDGIREVLARLTPADVHPASLAPGEVRRTRLAQVAVAFRFLSETEAELICFRSVAKYVFDALANAAGTGAPAAQL